MFLTFTYISTNKYESKIRVFFENIHILSVSKKIQITVFVEKSEQQDSIANSLKAKSLIVIALDVLSYLTNEPFLMEDFEPKKMDFKNLVIPRSPQFIFEGKDYLSDFERISQKLFILEKLDKVKLIQKMRMHRYRL